MTSPPTDLLSAGYDFLAPPRIAFGWGRRREVGRIARTLADRRAFVVCGSRTLSASGGLAEIHAALRGAQFDTVDAAQISREPEVDDVDRLAGFLRDQGVTAEHDLIVAVGGGSAIDLAKAAAALATNGGGESVVAYLEGVGAGLTISERPLPLLAMPTTGGTGSEATKNAVISNYNPAYKKSLRSDLMVPRAVLVDPELAVGVSRQTTTASGLDAITQCIESYISRRARPVAQALAAEGLRRAVPNLPIAVDDPANRPAREAMSHAALLSGMALANSGLGVAHGVAAALGVQARTPHGVACALMLPIALRTNRPNCEAPMAELARAVWPDHFASDSAAADALVERIVALCAAVGAPRRLRDLGVSREQIPALVAGSHGNSLDGNPVTLSDDQLDQILQGGLVIVAAGLSPAWQQILLFNRFTRGEVNRARESHWCASGKVLNVGLGLHSLGAESQTISPVGGPAGEMIEREFASAGASLVTIPSVAGTRVCTTILDRATDVTTELVEAAPPLSSAELAAFMSQFAHAAASATGLVLTGSLPAGTPATFYRDLLQDAPAVPAILDARGPEMLAALFCRPLVVKPNREELEITFGRELTSDADLFAAMRELNQRGALWVVVSSGRQALFASNERAIYRLTPPAVANAINPIGCGDALTAGMAWGISRGAADCDETVLNAIRLGMAAAADRLRQILPAKLDAANTERIAAGIKVQEIAR